MLGVHVCGGVWYGRSVKDAVEMLDYADDDDDNGDDETGRVNMENTPIDQYILLRPTDIQTDQRICPSAWWVVRDHSMKSGTVAEER